MIPGIRLVLEYFKVPEFCLALAAVLVLLVGIVASAGGSPLGPPYLPIGLMMLSSALNSRGYLAIPRLDEILPVLPVSGILGILLLFSSLLSFAYGGGWWTTWVIFAASILSLYSAFLKLRRPPPLY
jgi:hypothetical protein